MPFTSAMCNPWLAIPLGDYEGHMASPGIAQAPLLAQILADAHAKYSPRAVAILGCAGGNGFEAMPPSITRRVVGIDLNPQYIAATRARYAGRFESLELHVADIQARGLRIAPVELVYAALVLEYVSIADAVANTRQMLVDNGHLISVVQLPHASMETVTPSPYTSLRKLKDAMHLVAPQELERVAGECGYMQIESRMVATPGGKLFQVQDFAVAKTKTPPWSAR